MSARGATEAGEYQQLKQESKENYYRHQLIPTAVTTQKKITEYKTDENRHIVTFVAEHI